MFFYYLAIILLIMPGLLYAHRRLGGQRFLFYLAVWAAVLLAIVVVYNFVNPQPFHLPGLGERAVSV